MFPTTAVTHDWFYEFWTLQAKIMDQGTLINLSQMINQTTNI